MTKRKKALCSASSSEESQPKSKRQALMSCMLMAFKEDLMQEVRKTVVKTVREEFLSIKEELKHEISLPSKLTRRPSSSRCIERSNVRNLQLHFKTRLSVPIFTGKRLEGKDSTPIDIELIDANTGNIVKSGPEASVQLNVVVLGGDFRKDNGEWTREEFEKYQLAEREGKGPLVIGDQQVVLKNGVAVLGELKFTDNSSWYRSKTFRIGLKVAPGCCEGIPIREAITEPLRVKDHRGELDMKHHPPASDDEVWRLEKIAKDKPLHNRLKKEGINVVEDFLIQLIVDPKRLKKILGNGMAGHKWTTLTNHAKSCDLKGKLYMYRDAMSNTVVFNSFGQLRGVVTDHSYQASDSLPDEEKVYWNSLVKVAYENWDHVRELNFASSSGSVQCTRSRTTEAEAVQGQKQIADATNRRSEVGLKVSPGSSVMAGEGCNDSIVAGNRMHSPNGNSNSILHNERHHPLNHAGLPPHENLTAQPNLATLISSQGAHYNGLFQNQLNHSSNLLELPHQLGSPACASLEGDLEWLSSLLEDNPDPGIFSNENTPHPHSDDASRQNGYAGFASSCGSGLSGKGNGRGVVGWLMIKAVMKWGFFVRRAPRVRPTIAELDEIQV